MFLINQIRFLYPKKIEAYGQPSVELEEEGLNTMRKLLLTLLILVIAANLRAAKPIGSLQAFSERVREITEQHDRNLFPDATMYDLRSEAIAWTSIDIGGVESTYGFTTTINVSRYVLPDSTVKILFANVYTKVKQIWNLKAWYPQYITELGTSTNRKLGGDTLTGEPVPSAYNWWNDSLQLMPTPIRSSDTVYLKLYIEHPKLDTIDSDSLILFENYGYTEAALVYAVKRTYETVRLFDEATYFNKEYGARKADLMQAQTRKLESQIREP